MVRSILIVVFFFTVIPRLTGRGSLRMATLLGFSVYMAGQLTLVAIPVAQGGATARTYLFLGVCLLLDAFGGGILAMLAESLVALHVNREERSRVMAIQRTCVMLATAPFGWIAGWLSSMNRSWPFLLTAGLLAIGIVLASRFWVPTPTHREGN